MLHNGIEKGIKNTLHTEAWRIYNSADERRDFLNENELVYVWVCVCVCVRPDN